VIVSSDSLVCFLGIIWFKIHFFYWQRWRLDTGKKYICVPLLILIKSNTSILYQIYIYIISLYTDDYWTQTRDNFVKEPAPTKSIVCKTFMNSLELIWCTPWRVLWTDALVFLDSNLGTCRCEYGASDPGWLLPFVCADSLIFLGLGNYHFFSA